MGWLKIKQQHLSRTVVTQPVDEASSNHEHLKSSTQHIEFAPSTTKVKPRPRTRHFANIKTPDNELPYISSDEVKAKRGNSDNATQTWIVIDDIVYDCSEFCETHPGGYTVITSFNGSDCSWQFWRFHDKQNLKDFGTSLRIGRTTKVGNLFKEPARFLGLRRLGGDEDEW